MQVLEVDAVWTPDGIRTEQQVGIADGRVAGIWPAGTHAGAEPLPGRLMLPGAVNAHSHAFQRAFRGHVQWRASGADDFWSWRDRMYATANRLDPDGVEAVSALAFLEMIESGITHVGEFHYLHHAPDGTPYADPEELALRVVAAARRVGLRITLLRVAYARAGAGLPARPDQARFVDARPEDVLAAIERLRRLEQDPMVQVGLAAHSVRALDRAWLDVLGTFDGVVHAHVSEQPAENRACVEEHGVSPLEVLHRAGLVHDRFTAVHLTWPLDGDVERLASAGGSVCACPTTELDLGDGFLPRAAAQALPICLGSDSHAVIDLWQEARSVELHLRGVHTERNVLAPEGAGRDALASHVLEMATTNGARALGVSECGVAVGAPADLVTLDLRRSATQGVPPLAAAAFVAHPSWVDGVWVSGEAQVCDGRHPLREAIWSAAAPYLEPA